MFTFEKENNKITLKIKIEKADWDKAVDQTYEDSKGKFNIQGFRKGKAPRRVIEQNYGENVFIDETLERLVTNEYRLFLDQNMDVEPIETPAMALDKFDDTGVEVTLTVNILPEIELGAYTGLTFKKDEVNVSEEDMNNAIDRFMQGHSRFVESQESAQLGDFVTIDFSGSVDGEKFEGGTATDYRLELGSHSFIDTFEDQMVGMNVGDTRDVNVTFPEEYHAENLKGKPAVFEVVMKKIERKEIPTLDDKFISDTTDFENVDEYKKDLESKLRVEANKKAERKLENDMIEKIVADSKIDLPEVLVNRELDHIIDDIKNRLAYQGLKFEDYEKYTGQTEELIRKDRHDDAVKSVKTRLAFQKIVRDNKLMVTIEDIDAKVAEFAARYKREVEDFRKNLTERDYAIIENDLLMDKIFNFLKTNNKID